MLPPSPVPIVTCRRRKKKSISPWAAIQTFVLSLLQVMEQKGLVETDGLRGALEEMRTFGAETLETYRHMTVSQRLKAGFQQGRFEVRYTHDC